MMDFLAAFSAGTLFGMLFMLFVLSITGYLDPDGK